MSDNGAVGAGYATCTNLMEDDKAQRLTHSYDRSNEKESQLKNHQDFDLTGGDKRNSISNVD